MKLNPFAINTFGYKINSRKRKLSPYHSVMPAISIFSGTTEMTCRNVILAFG